MLQRENTQSLGYSITFFGSGKILRKICSHFRINQHKKEKIRLCFIGEIFGINGLKHNRV